MLAADKLQAKKTVQGPDPLAGLTVTGAGIEQHQHQPIDPLAGLTSEERAAYCLESLLYYAQQSAERRSPCKKGVYYMLAFTPLSVYGLHKLYIGKVVQGVVIQFLCAVFGVFSGGWLLFAATFILSLWAGIEAYRDRTGRPLLDAQGRELQ